MIKFIKKLILYISNENHLLTLYKIIRTETIKIMKKIINYLTITIMITL